MSGAHSGRSSETKPDHVGHHHRKDAVKQVATQVVTVSDTRTFETDTGGALVVDFLEAEGFSELATICETARCIILCKL